MEAFSKNNDVYITSVTDFKLSDIFDCGQCFRFNKLDNGDYLGTAFSKTVRISQLDDTVILHNTSMDDYRNIWCDFLDLNRDYGEIKKKLTYNNDAVMAEAVNYGTGIRILNQDLWETIVSFIISASNNIPRIKKIIELLCQNFGDGHTYEGHTYYSFPSAQKIAQLSVDDLSVIRAGFRTKYIIECSKRVASNEFSLEKLVKMQTKDAKKYLMTLPGIGNKVSDCILLFSLGRFNSFPIDVWIKRIMEYCYFENQPQNIATISQFAEKTYGDLGGIAQQYLFYYARSLRIGT